MWTMLLARIVERTIPAPQSGTVPYRMLASAAGRGAWNELSRQRDSGQEFSPRLLSKHVHTLKYFSPSLFLCGLLGLE